MAARRGKNQARRNSSSQGTPGWVWLVAGVAIAAVVFLAAPNLFKGEGDGFLRAGPQPNPNAQPAPVADVDSDAGAPPAAQPAAPKPAEAEKPATTQYDFYTLLPGKEVEMSDAELAASARAEAALLELNQRLEGLVAERTADLTRANSELKVEVAERLSAEDLDQRPWVVAQVGQGNTVARGMAAMTALGSNLAIQIILLPLMSAPWMATNRPWTWKMGNA